MYQQKPNVLYTRIAGLLQFMIKKFDDKLSTETRNFLNTPVISKSSDKCKWNKKRGNILQQIEEAYVCDKENTGDCTNIISELDACLNSRNETLKAWERFVTKEIIGTIIPTIVEDQLKHIEKTWKKQSHKELAQKIVKKFGNDLVLYMAQTQQIETINHKVPIDILRKKRSELQTLTSQHGSGNKLLIHKAKKLIKECTSK